MFFGLVSGGFFWLVGLLLVLCGYSVGVTVERFKSESSKYFYGYR